MARQVYFDPFGNSLRGYRQGQQDEQTLQHNTRAARLADYNFNSVLPLHTQILRNQADLSSYSLPTQEKMVDLGLDRAKNNLYTQNLGLADELARRTHVTSPMERLMAQHFNITPEYDENGNVAYYAQTPEGRVQVGAIHNPNEALFSYVNEPRVLNEAKFMNALDTGRYRDYTNRLRALGYLNYAQNVGRYGARGNYGDTTFGLGGMYTEPTLTVHPDGTTTTSAAPSPEVNAYNLPQTPTEQRNQDAFHSAMTGAFWY